VRADEPAPRGERYAPFIARRFVRARRQGFLSLIALLSALGFLVGVASLIIALALMTGFQEDVVRRILGANAHLIVFPMNQSRTIEDPDAALAALARVPGVAACEPMVQGYGGIVAPGGEIQWTSLSGIDPRLSREVTDIAANVREGSLDALAAAGPSGRPGIVIGRDMASRLGVTVGDVVRVMVPRPRVSPWGVSVRTPTFEVVGVFSTGFHDYDLNWSFIPLETAQEIWGTGKGVHRLGVRTKDLADLRQTQQALSRALSAPESGGGFFVSSILEHNRPFFAALRLEKLLMFVAVGLIVIVAALGVVSTLVLTVTQKRREIGVLVALGATPSGVMRIFVLQGLSMGVLGTLLGAALGVGLAVLLDRFQLIKLDPSVYYLDHLPFTVQPGDLAAIVGIAVLVALLATLYPAWRAARLDPVESLRHE
jgi:lipoprotein-releasing system permease protein